MVTLTPELTDSDVAARDAFVGRLFTAGIEAGEIFTIYIGDRLGLYRALADGVPITPPELAQRTHTHPRYAREWLEQQAVAGILGVDNVDASPDARAYSLPAAHAEVLLDADSLNYLAPLARIVTGVAATLPAVLRAFADGGGVEYPSYGADTREGQGALNWTMHINLLGTDWLPSIPDVHARLTADPPARVADIAAGTGWSSIAIARAYPKVHVDSFDADEASVALARLNVAAEELDARVTVHRQDAADPSLGGEYDLVTVFEAIHDMANPVGALTAIRRIVRPGGAVVIADERVQETFTAPADDVERFMYVSSVLFCLPTAMAEQPSTATGTAMRSSIMRTYAQKAGFQRVDILPIEHPFWRFYRLFA